ncbi:MAG: DUF935 family protein, partial [Rhodospirillales bacterium]|nr:DUF935 family protein [Rhodospirillales bacterium]
MSNALKPPAPELREFAASGDATNFAATFADELAIPRDAILKGQAGGDYEVYQRMKRDDQVAACWQQRVRAAIKCEWFVEPGGDKAPDKRAADFIREELAAIRFDRVCEKMLNAAYYGYSVAECLWRADGGLFRFHGIKTRNLR